MMKKIRLLLWMLALGVSSVALLRDVAWSEDPATAVMMCVRVAAGVAALYLLAATVLAVRLPRLAPSFVRQLVATAIGTGLALTPMIASAAPASPPPGVEAPVLRRLPDAPTPSRDPALAHVPVSGTENEMGDAATVTVVAGDSLWSIAEHTLAERLGRAPSDAEIVPYWERLIDANRALLTEAGPDLIFPQQVFVLPS
jgi:nucleoid-associated protein YgaU